MEAKINLNAVYQPSEDVVGREIEDEFIIVPLTSGIGDLENEIFTLNATGRAIWKRLDGRNSLKDVVKDLMAEFEVTAKESREDVIGFVEELLNRKMLIEISKA